MKPAKLFTFCIFVADYLNYFKKEMSLGQNVDMLLFDKKAWLANEFNRLFRSLFANYEEYKNIVLLLSKKRMGCSRTEIAQSLGRTSGGALTNMLIALENSGFIRHYCPLGNKKYDLLYKLADPLCRFYTTFVEGNTDMHFWQNSRNEGNVAAWRGLSFEELCADHIDKIKDALKVGGVLSQEAALTIKGENGAKEHRSTWLSFARIMW